MQGVSLTGSERAGAAVAEIAGRNLKKVVLELGGSDPFIVLSSDDLDATVEAAIAGRFENTGQACNAAKRFIVAEDIYDAFVDKFTKKVLETAESLPPLSSVAAAERLDEQVNRAVDNGATLVSEGQRKGAYFPPGVLTNVSPDSPAYREELFGPVATVYKVASEEEAVEVANDTPFGLGSYVFTTDKEQGSPGRRPDRSGHGVRQPGRRRQRRTAVRRCEAVRLRPRARQVRHRRVREQETHPRRLKRLRFRAADGSSTRRTAGGIPPRWKAGCRQYLTPGGFEKSNMRSKDTRQPKTIADLASRFGCDALGDRRWSTSASQQMARRSGDLAADSSVGVAARPKSPCQPRCRGSVGVVTGCSTVAGSVIGSGRG